MQAKQTLSAVAIAIHVPTAAQNAIGDWEGALTPELNVVVHIAEPLEGAALVGTLDSPDQGVTGLALANVSASEGALRFEVPAVNGAFEGKWNSAENAWAGQWSQGGPSMPLTLRASKRIAPSPIKVVEDWKLPSSIEVASILDKAISARPGIAFAAAVSEPGESFVVTRGPANDDTLFEIGSLTKLFTSLVLADMVVAGEVRLDDPVARYLPDKALVGHGHRPVTLRDLASHISGFPRLPTNLAPSDPADPYADFDEAKLLAFLKSHIPSRSPGAMFEYSNFGAGLLGYALSRAAGKPYATLLSERILKPLAMTKTCVGFCTKGSLAQPYGPGGKAVPAWSFGTLAGAGGVRSSATDMARFASALADPPVALKPAVDLMLANRRPAGAGREIGLGVFIAPTTNGEILFHDGATAGSQSSLVVDRETKRAVVVLTNSGGRPAPGPIALNLITGREIGSRN